MKTNEATASKQQAKKGFPFSKARAVTAIAVAVIVILGAALHLGAGVPCAIGVDRIAAICPVGALEVMLGSKEVMLHPLVLLAVAVIVILVAGKAFCSWICPVPWLRRLFTGKAAENGDSKVHVGADPNQPARLQQLANTDIAAGSSSIAATDSCDPTVPTVSFDPASYSIAPKFDAACGSHASHACSTCAGCEALKAVGGKRDGVQVDSRHIVLLGALGSAAIFGFPVLCLICPVGLTFAFLVGVCNMFQFNEPSLALIAAPVVLVIEVVFLRKWCTKFCPISALVSLVSAGNKTFKPKVDESRCLRGKGIDCHACVETCPEQLDPHSKMIPECSKCSACVEACPAHAISIKALRL